MIGNFTPNSVAVYRTEKRRDAGSRLLFKVRHGRLVVARTTLFRLGACGRSDTNSPSHLEFRRFAPALRTPCSYLGFDRCVRMFGVPQREQIKSPTFSKFATSSECKPTEIQKPTRSIEYRKRFSSCMAVEFGLQDEISPKTGNLASD